MIYRNVLVTALLLAMLFSLGVLPSYSAEEEPSLPTGLGASQTQGTEPKEPSLPSGLGGSGQKSQPDLPEGLKGGGEPKEQANGRPGTEPPFWREPLGFPIHGFIEGRVGPRLHSDPRQSEDITIGETRLQLETERYWPAGRLQFEVTSDFVADGVTEEGSVDLRRLRLTWTPIPSVDIRAGRQVLSWGTGDQLFINDLFPKDWQSFLIGRDSEYLKAPGDAVRVGWFTDIININLVYTPHFDPDRYITGERLSYYSPQIGRLAGSDNEVDADEPNDWLEDDEWAVRLYRTLGSYSVALYGYSGYWKSPGGQDPSTGESIFPELNVAGASLQGPIGPGIGNIEVGYYDSEEDRDGQDPFVKNSEARLLVGYEQELAHELTGSVQYYLEHMMDYDAYRRALPQGQPTRDEDRQVITLRLTKLLFNQDLTLSVFAFYSPTDEDGYVRPRATYELTDSWTAEAGANLFQGEKEHTFFGQFEDSSNVYLSLRYSF